MRKRFGNFESLEKRTVLDASGLCVCPIEFDDSPLVTEREDGTLRFASLNVGRIDFPELGDVLEEDAVVEVGDHQLTIRQTKEFLHGFADHLGTDQIIETADIRLSPWGTGAGSTTAQFELFMVDQLENQEPCTALQFSTAVLFERPGDGGEFFTGGFLDLEANGQGGFLPSGDAVHVVQGYEIESTLAETTLTVRSETFGEATFIVRDDFSLVDEFGQVWNPDRDDYAIGDPNTVDELLGDLDEDGQVNFADFLLLADNFGKEAELGDLDGDGMVDFSDFLILADNFGNGAA